MQGMLNGKLFVLLSAFAVTGSFAASAHALSTGVASTAWAADPSKGCKLCHTGGTAPTVTFRTADGTAVSSLSVDRAATVDLIVRIAGGQTNGSFNVSPSAGATVGELKVSTDTLVKTIVGASAYTEVTHTAARPYTSGNAEFRFTFDPADTVACGTTVTLTAWGASTDGAGATTGDNAATDTLGITINCGGDAGADGGGTTDAGADGGGTTDAGSGADAAGDGASSETGAGEAGMTDTGASDTGMSDTGMSDTGASDTGMSDTGMSDTGASDTGMSDAGAEPAPASDDGCGCRTPRTGATDSAGVLALAAVALAIARRRR